MSLQKSDLNEKTIQTGIAKRLGELGWVYSDDELLGRRIDDVFYYQDLEAALVRLNPEIAKKPERIHEVVSKLRLVLSSLSIDGLVITRLAEEYEIAGNRVNMNILRYLTPCAPEVIKGWVAPADLDAPRLELEKAEQEMTKRLKAAGYA